MKYEKVNIVDVIVIAGLLIGLVMAIFYGMNELSFGIVGVLGGYVGGTSRPQNHQNINDRGEQK